MVSTVRFLPSSNQDEDDGVDWVNTDNAQTDDTAFTRAGNSAEGQHGWGTFGITGVSGTIDGITVEANIRDAFGDGNSGAIVELSWDGGTSWTSVGATHTLARAANTFDLVSVGGIADTWGRTWTVAELSDANFIVRLDSAPGVGNFPEDFEMRVLGVYIEYTPPGGGGISIPVVRNHLINQGIS